MQMRGALQHKCWECCDTMRGVNERKALVSVFLIPQCTSVPRKKGTATQIGGVHLEFGDVLQYFFENGRDWGFSNASDK